MLVIGGLRNEIMCFVFKRINYFGGILVIYNEEKVVQVSIVGLLDIWGCCLSDSDLIYMLNIYFQMGCIMIEIIDVSLLVNSLN